MIEGEPAGALSLFLGVGFLFELRGSINTLVSYVPTREM